MSRPTVTLPATSKSSLIGNLPFCSKTYAILPCGPKSTTRPTISGRPASLGGGAFISALKVTYTCSTPSDRTPNDLGRRVTFRLNRKIVKWFISLERATGSEPAKFGLGKSTKLAHPTGSKPYKIWNRREQQTDYHENNRIRYKIGEDHQPKPAHQGDNTPLLLPVHEVAKSN